MGVLYSVVFDMATQIAERINDNETRYRNEWEALDHKVTEVLWKIDNHVGVEPQVIEDIRDDLAAANHAETAYRKLVNEDLTRIARKYLSIPTLTTRSSDSLDFHEVGVWSVTEALAAAYQLGLEAGVIRGAKAMAEPRLDTDTTE